LINTLIFGEKEGDSHDPPVQGADKISGDIDTIVSSTEGRNKRGKPSSERNTQSHAISHKILFPKVNARSAMNNKENPQVTI
jgi:hypothetical protein